MATRQLRLQLCRGLSYKNGDLEFRRGTPLPIPNEGRYNELVRTGYVADPDQRFQYIHPSAIAKAEDGTDILVIRDMGLGDVLMVTLALRALAEQYPRLNFRYATSSIYVPLLRDCQFLAGIQSIVDTLGELRWVIDLRGYSERAEDRYVRNRIDLFADHLGVTIRDYDYPFRVRDSEKAKAQDILRDTPRPRVGVAVRGSTAVRSWPFDHVTEFCNLAAAAGWGPVLLDHKRFGHDNPEVTNLTARLSLLDLAAVVSECDLVVSPDTGTAHLAEAVGTKTLAIYSTIDPAMRVSHYKHTEVIWLGNEGLNCAPCWDRGCPELHCLRGVKPERVMMKAEEMLAPEPTLKPIGAQGQWQAVY